MLLYWQGANIRVEHDFTNITFSHQHIYQYSGTSDKGYTVLRTQYKKPPYRGQVFVTQITISLYFLGSPRICINKNIGGFKFGGAVRCCHTYTRV